MAPAHPVSGPGLALGSHPCGSPILHPAALNLERHALKSNALGGTKGACRTTKARVKLGVHLQPPAQSRNWGGRP